MSEMPSNTPNITDVIRKVTRDIEEGKPIREAAANEVVLPDPSPSPMEVHHERLHSMINNARAVALDSCRLVIEEQHEAMRALQQTGDTLAETIDHFLHMSQVVVDQCRIIHEAWTVTRQQFGPTLVMEPQPPATKPAKHNGKRN